MKIITAPAKTMSEDCTLCTSHQLPQFMEETSEILRGIRDRSGEEMQKIWKCSDSIAEINMKRFSEMDPYRAVTPAILSYGGIQYDTLKKGGLDDSVMEYLEDHLRILSGFYGIVRPQDAVVPYRLEMQSKLPAGGHKDLYSFWGSKLYDAIASEYGSESRFTILDLASKEYSKAVRKYKDDRCRFVTVEFGEIISGRFRQKATPSKIARGDMVRFMADQDIQDVEDIKEYRGGDFIFSEDLSEKDRIVFVRQN